MGTWCDNTLFLYRDKEVIQACIHLAKTDESALSFAQIVPVPDDWSGTLEEWGLESWGSERDAWDVKITASEDSVAYQFKTVRHGAIPFADWVKKLYPRLRVELLFRERATKKTKLAVWSDEEKLPAA